MVVRSNRTPRRWCAGHRGTGGAWFLQYHSNESNDQEDTTSQITVEPCIAGSPPISACLPAAPESCLPGTSRRKLARGPGQCWHRPIACALDTQGDLL